MPSHEITCYTPRHRIPYHVLGLYERARRSCIARHSFTCSPTSSPLSLFLSLYRSISDLLFLANSNRPSIHRREGGRERLSALPRRSFSPRNPNFSLPAYSLYFLVTFLFPLLLPKKRLNSSLFFFFFFETWLRSLSLGWSHRVDTFDLCSLIATFHSFNPITVVRYSFNRRYDYENSLFFFLGFVNIERFVQKGVVKRNWRMVKRSGEAWLAYKKRRTEV